MSKCFFAPAAGECAGASGLFLKEDLAASITPGYIATKKRLR
jgi:hypothetical protein